MKRLKNVLVSAVAVGVMAWGVAWGAEDKTSPAPSYQYLQVRSSAGGETGNVYVGIQVYNGSVVCASNYSGDQPTNPYIGYSGTKGSKWIQTNGCADITKIDLMGYVYKDEKYVLISGASPSLTPGTGSNTFPAPTADHPVLMLNIGGNASGITVETAVPVGAP